MGHVGGERKNAPKASLFARWITAVLIAVVCVCFLAVPSFPSVTVREVRSGRIAAAFPIGKGGTLRLSYIHSLNKGAVLDEFLVDGDGSLVLVRSVFQSFGAGMSDGLEPGVSMRLTPDGVELSGINRKIGVLRMAVGTIADHRLRAAGREFALAELVGPGSFVKIAYERITLYEAVRQRIWNGKE